MPRDIACKTRGQDGFAVFLSCRALSSPTTCRFIPALSGLPVTRAQSPRCQMATSPVCQPDRHGGSGCALTPATRPCVRVCTRRLEMINRNLLVRISLVSASSLLLPLLSLAPTLLLHGSRACNDPERRLLRVPI